MYCITETFQRSDRVESDNRDAVESHLIGQG